MANITVNEFINRLKELPENYVVSENVLNQCHALISVDNLLKKKVKITLNVEIPIKEIAEENDYFSEFFDDCDFSSTESELMEEYLDESDQLTDIIFNNYEVEVID